jgi:hypothetical protein
VISACGKSLSNKCNGKAGSTEESPATKCSLKVRMARSAAFRGDAAMTVRRHQLVSDVIDGEEILQSGGCLVVESFELWILTLDSELLMNAAICVDPL